MQKTREQLEKDYSLAVKAILTDFETVAKLDHDEACHPDFFNEVRRRVVRRIWDLYNASVAHAESNRFFDIERPE